MTCVLDWNGSFRELILADICALMISQQCSSTDTVSGLLFLCLFPCEVQERIFIKVAYLRKMIDLFLYYFLLSEMKLLLLHNLEAHGQSNCNMTLGSTPSSVVHFSYISDIKITIYVEFTSKRKHTAQLKC